MAFVIPAYPRFKRYIKQTLTLAGLAGTLAFSSLSSPLAYAKKPKPLNSVADLRYGVALYNYYQNKNLEALTELLVADKKGGIQGHGDNPEIMEGGFSMAYGMERKASDIFERLLGSNRPQKTRDAAWYNLAKLRYLRQDWTGTVDALARMEGKTDPSIALEVKLLRFNLAIKQDLLERAEGLLNDKRVQKNNIWQPYMYFNIASAYSRQGNYGKGIEYFRRLLTMKQREPEFLALYDKAMTAAGYAYMLNDNFSSALELFSRVRLDSPLSNRALLGYGWAAAEQEDYLHALKPWDVLSKRSLIDENTQESLIAIPYAYEKLNRKGLALKGFQNAETNFLSEIQVLDGVIGDVQGSAIREALNIDRSTDFNWLNYAQKNQLSPRLSYLIELFSREAFISLVQELRDLLAIQNQYNEWQAKLGFYGEMINEREQNRSEQVDFVVQQDLNANITAMEKARDNFAEKIDGLQKNNAFLSVLDNENTKKYERILRAEENIKILKQASHEHNLQVMPEDELQTLSETLRKQKGFMIWRSQAMYDERLWRAKHELAQVNETLLLLRERQEVVQGVVSQNQDLQTFRQRISTSERRLAQQVSDVEQEIEFIQDKLSRKVLHVLQLQRVRLKHYLAQSRLSIARILDQAAIEQPPVDQPTPTEAEEIAPPTDDQEKTTEEDASS